MKNQNKPLTNQVKLIINNIKTFIFFDFSQKGLANFTNDHYYHSKIDSNQDRK